MEHNMFSKGEENRTSSQDSHGNVFPLRKLPSLPVQVRGVDKTGSKGNILNPARDSKFPIRHKKLKEK